MKGFEYDVFSPNISPSLCDNRTIADLPQDRLVKLLESSRVICAQIKPKAAISSILNECLKSIVCDLCVLYVFDTYSNSLIPIYSEKVNDNVELLKSKTKIKLTSQSEVARSFNSGIATCSTSIMRERNYIVLTVPIWDAFVKVRAVLEFMKQCDDRDETLFSNDDKVVADQLSTLAGTALRNSALYKDALTSRDLADGLLTVLSSLRCDLGIQSALLSLTTHAKQIVQAEHCGIYLIDRVCNNLLSLSTDRLEGPPMKIPFDPENERSILGECARKAESIVIEQPGTLSSDESVSNMAVIPIKGESGHTIGLIELVNKRDEEGDLLAFTDEDIRFLELFGRLVGPNLQLSELGAKASRHVPSEAGRALDTNLFERSHFRRPSITAPSIREEPEESLSKNIESPQDMVYFPDSKQSTLSGFDIDEISASKESALQNMRTRNRRGRKYSTLALRLSDEIKSLSASSGAFGKILDDYYMNEN